MIKAFYKTRPPIKVFFDEKMQYRSLAYGSDVYNGFLDWVGMHLKKKSIFGDRYLLWQSAGIYGEEYGVKPDTPKGAGESVLPPLCVENTIYTVESSGHISINGKKNILNLGSEMKAWGVSVFPGEYGEMRILFVIAKPAHDPEMCLTAYEMIKGDVKASPLVRLPLEHSMEPSSRLFCFGKQIFIIHNSKLGYYYFDYDKKVLDTVPIGEDGDNAEFDWCRRASSFVANGRGYVFWISDGTVYGFPIGYPRRLLKLTCGPREIPVHLRCDESYLYVYRKDKNNGRVACFKYAQSTGGGYEEVTERKPEPPRSERRYF